MTEDESTMSKRRDAAYYEGRLRRDFPSIYVDLRSGKIKSVRQAAAKAGLIHLPDRLAAMKRDWKRSSPHERSEFLKWIRSSGVGLKPGATRSIADAKGRLTPQAIAFLSDWKRKKRVTPGQVMKQMGFKNHDYRLAQSLNGKVGLPPDVLAALRQWLLKHGF
jgi:hypothetical protein